MSQRPDIKRRLIRFWEEWRSLVIFLAVMVLFRSAIADWNQVPSGSMKPTILEGDRVVVNKLAYDLKVPFTTWRVAAWSDPRPGEIVTFYSPEDGKLLIKRIIGVPGDIISMRNNQLYVNGKSALYSRLDDDIVNQLDAWQRTHHAFFYEQFGDVVHAVMLRPSHSNDYNSFGPLQIPADHYLMLGDNRDNSSDSRAIGLIPRDQITGRAHTIAFSVDYEDWYLPRKDRFIKPLQ
ncbi:MAG: signal peptidase I [Pseudomonadales bacterium]|nr:signal peptidase I [Pseudomonadales bacterium]